VELRSREQGGPTLRNRGAPAKGRGSIRRLGGGRKEKAPAKQMGNRQETILTTISIREPSVRLSGGKRMIRKKF